MPKSRKVWFIRILVLVAVIFGTLLIFSKFITPWGTARQLQYSIESNCRTCKIEFGRISYAIFNPGELFLIETKFRSGTPGGTEVEAYADEIRIKVSTIRLMLGRFHIEKIEIKEPHVLVRDGDLKVQSPKSQKSDEDKELFQFSIGESEIKDGEFTYERVEHKTSSKLYIHKISGKIFELGTLPGLVDKSTRAEVTAQLEKSGSVDLKIDAYLFKRPLNVDVNLEIKNQNLGDVTPFFQSNDGLVLKGLMIQAIGQVKVRDRNLHASVDALYKDFDLEFKKDRDRSAATAFFSNLFESLAIFSKNTKHDPSQRLRSVDLVRDVDESLVSFILRGLKDAALKVSMSGPQKKNSSASP